MTGNLSVLATLPENRETLPLPKGASIELRALSMDDLAALVRDHAPAIADAVRTFRGDQVAAILTIAGAVPAVVAHVVALAAGEPDAVATARRLPLGIIHRALCIIDRLTFGASGDRQPMSDVFGPLLRQFAPHVVH